jgi:hypothetical protein
MALIFCNGVTPMEDAYAKRAAESLVTAYPNHSWWVECKGGALIIKHFGISGTLGMVRHLASLDSSATAFKREVVRAAGELLERAGLPRRDYRGETVKSFDGDRYTKHWHKRPGMHMKVIH